MHPAQVPNSKYLLVRQLFKLVGSNFRIFDQSGQLVYFCHQKGFKLREDIRIFSDEAQSNEVLRIAARKIIDFSAAYDVIDSATNQKVGAFKRKGWKSMVRDEWVIMDVNDVEIGKVIEDSIALALIRRLLTNLIPQNYDLLLLNGVRAVDLRQNFNPFTYKLNIEFSSDPAAQIDHRMGIVAGILLAAIEGRQSG